MEKSKKKYIARKVHGICHLSVIPVRSNPSGQSNLISQMLYGDTCRLITKKHNDWARIITEWDEVEGWINCRQITLITEKQYNRFSSSYANTLELLQSAMSGSSVLPVIIGSSLPLYDGLSYQMPDGKYFYNGQVFVPGDNKLKVDIIRKIAMKYLHAPYYSGGRTPFGIDSGAFIQMVYKIVGIRMGRLPTHQATEGEWIHFVHEAQAGDIAFFENEDGRIVHAGIILGDNKIIHAHDWVRVDTLDHYGIYRKEIKSYTHKLRVIKRIVEFHEEVTNA